MHPWCGQAARETGMGAVQNVCVLGVALKKGDFSKLLAADSVRRFGHMNPSVLFKCAWARALHAWNGRHTHFTHPCSVTHILYTL